MLADLGAFVIDADALAREAVAPRSTGLRAIGERWPDVIRADASLDRAALAALIFDDADARAFANERSCISACARAPWSSNAPRPTTRDRRLHEVPLLFETGYACECDATLLVVAPLERRIARVMARMALTRAQIEARIATQIDPRRARALADFVIENDATLSDLRERVEKLWERLLAIRTRPENR